MRRYKRQKLMYLLFLSNFFLWFCYLFITNTTVFTTFETPLSQEEIAAQLMQKALGSRGSNASLLVLPNENTIIYEPEVCQDRGRHIHVLLVVISSPGNRNARNAVRYNLKAGVENFNERRWNSDIRRNNSLIFFTGVSTNPNTQNKLEEEAGLFGDIVIDNLLDTYLNLTVKVLRVFKWVRRNCPEANFVLKIDDDVHLNLLKWLEFLRQISEKPFEGENLIGGHYYANKTPVRTVLPPYGKWFVPYSVWPEDKYPDFIGGPGYILGSEALRKIYEASLSTPLFPLEDVFISGIIGNWILGMKLTGIQDIVMTWELTDPFFTTSCFIQKKFLIHSLKPQELKCWRDLNQKDFACSHWPLVISTLLC